MIKQWKTYKRIVGQLTTDNKILTRIIQVARDSLNRANAEAIVEEAKIGNVPWRKATMQFRIPRPEDIPKIIEQEFELPRPEKPKELPQIEHDEPMDKCTKMIYALLLSATDKSFTRPQIGLATGYSYSSGSFNNAISKLNTMGLLRKEGERLTLNNSGGFRYMDSFPEINLDFWLNKLGKCSREILIYLRGVGSQQSRDDIAISTGYSSESGSFNNSISELNVLGFTKKEGSLISYNKEEIERITI